MFLVQFRNGKLKKFSIGESCLPLNLQLFEMRLLKPFSQSKKLNENLFCVQVELTSIKIEKDIIFKQRNKQISWPIPQIKYWHAINLPHKMSPNWLLP